MANRPHRRALRATPSSRRVTKAAGAALLSALASVVLPLAAQGEAVQEAVQDAVQRVGYTAADEDFPNPERGFHQKLAPFWIGAARSPLRPEDLAGHRQDGMSLVAAYFVIDEYRDEPLSARALDEIALDFAAVREAGLKIVPRFAYSFPCVGALEPCDTAEIAAQADDPPLGRVLEHIDQLAPLLKANADVIAYMEMGFVGAWGEWHHSSSRLVNPDRTLNDRSLRIIDRVLQALPASRMVTMRYPFHKAQHAGSWDPLTGSEAFTGSPRSRIGAHNDCLLSNDNDSGTYSPPREWFQKTAAMKKFLHLDNRFVPQGGETCSAGPAAAPLIRCQSAVLELSTMRWSSLNVGYQPQVIDLWRRDGCFEEIRRRLGYRFRLVEAQAPLRAGAGGPFAVSITVANDGWAAPYNPRQVELVFRQLGTGRTYTHPVDVDPRFWSPGQTHLVEMAESLPAGMEPGVYQLLLNLPDAEASLYGRPEFSIRFANAGLWEPSTGYNDLRVRIDIAP